ncbi:MAG: hypothetical protein Q9216_004216 [Gyalolechia sp. 2 TL-2023]
MARPTAVKSDLLVDGSITSLHPPWEQEARWTDIPQVETTSPTRLPSQQRRSTPGNPLSSRLPTPKERIAFKTQTSRQRAFKPVTATFFGDLRYNLYTIWLFTFSDLKTIVGPKTAFGIVHAIYASEFGIPSLPLSSIASRIPVVLFWCWINLLPFAINNQRQDEAIVEDKLNKPWRPLPSARLSQRKAKLLVFSLYPTAILASSWIGGFYQSLALVVLGSLYNDWGGAEVNCMIRNLLNGAGYISFASGALSAAFGSQFTPTLALIKWLAVIFVVVATSVHSQDMYDQEGDSLRHRKTVPIVIGDARSRWTIAAAVGFWSVFCPWYIGTGNVYIVPPILGAIVMYRTLTKRTNSLAFEETAREEDKV